MKNKDFLWKLVTFFVGIAFGLGVWALYSFSQTAITPPVDCATRISVDVAHQCSQNYLDKATTPTEKIKGFAIDNCLFNTMNLMMTAAPAPTGFRIYLGADASGVRFWVLCGVDAAGADMTTNIYSAKSNMVDPCPTVCDAHSPVPGQ
jgi:hypothetical protein